MTEQSSGNLWWKTHIEAVVLQGFPLLVEYQRSPSDNLIMTVDIAKMLPRTVVSISFKLFSFDHKLGLFFPKCKNISIHET